MTIDFKCPECQKQYRVKEELAGKRLKCKSCGSPVQIPSPATSSDDDFFASLDEMAQMESRAIAQEENDLPQMPPKTGETKPKRKKKRPSTESDQREVRSQTNSLNVIIAVLCLVHSGGLLLLDWNVIKLILSLGINFGSILFLANILASVALVIAGIGIFIKAEWAVQIAHSAAIALLVLLGISVLQSMYYLLTSDLPFSWTRFLFRETLRRGAIPAIILWWSLQDPEV